MINFLFKGIIRDRSRSLFPVLIVTAGAFLVVLMHSWIKGVQNDLLWANAAFQTGHVKITTRAYAEISDLKPNDLAIIGVDSLTNVLKKDYPDMYWTPRILFGGLLDIPDENGETKSQAPIMGWGLDLSSNSMESTIFNLENALIDGRLPAQENEILISRELGKQLDVKIGETATLITTTMYGSLSMHNFVVVGTVRFGINAMDRGTIITRTSDCQVALDMDNAASEIFGFFPNFLYNEKRAQIVRNSFNQQQDAENEFSPVMAALIDQAGLKEMVQLFKVFSGVIVGLFIFAMSIVLWNAGLMGSLRRYGEIGVRLAVGESKGHVYRSLIGESILIGIAGAAFGTILGLIVSYYLQFKGIDISDMLKESAIMMSNVMRAQVTPASYFIGLIPGIFAPLLGTMISGIGIYKRNTAQLFKELEV